MKKTKVNKDDDYEFLKSLDLKVLCIYHGNCADGFTSAWVVHKYFMEHKTTVPVTLEFHAGVYQNSS